MINLLGLGKNKPKGVKVTIEYCPSSVTLPYKIKKIINEASVIIPEQNNSDPFGFTDKEVRVGEFLNELQVKHLVSQTRNYQNNYETVEIIERDYSDGDILLD
jgi:hypothetical protein